MLNIKWTPSKRELIQIEQEGGEKQLPKIINKNKKTFLRHLDSINDIQMDVDKEGGQSESHLMQFKHSPMPK